jgi:hypothetical protein
VDVEAEAVRWVDNGKAALRARSWGWRQGHSVGMRWWQLENEEVRMVTRKSRGRKWSANTQHKRC